jgi:hypothetical protein
LVVEDEIVKNKPMRISYKINDKTLEKLIRNPTQLGYDTNVFPSYLRTKTGVNLNDITSGSSYVTDNMQSSR